MVTNKEKDASHWRRIAGMLALVWGILLSVNIQFYMRVYTEQDILRPLSTIALYGFTIAGCFLLLIFPLQFYLYTFFCCLWGLLNIAEGGSVLGILLYGLGLFFAWKKGFFAVHEKLKCSLAGILIIAALFSQLRYGGTTFLNSCIDLLGLFTIVAVVVFLARHELQSLRTNKTEMVDLPQLQPTLSQPAKILTLPRARFKRDDVAVAQAILAGKRYAIIAREQRMGLSTLKRRVKTLFTYLGVADARTFIDTYEGYTVEQGTREIEEDSASPVANIRILPTSSESLSPEADSQA